MSKKNNLLRLKQSTERHGSLDLIIVGKDQQRPKIVVANVNFCRIVKRDKLTLEPYALSVLVNPYYEADQ